MALVVADRVKETTTSTGTGAITLGGAEPNFRTFSSVLSDADTTYYAIIDDNNLAFEVGLGTYASSGNTITRTTVLASSNSNNAVNFSAGTKDVFLTYPADKSVNRDASGNVSVSGGVTATSFTGPITATQVDLTGQGDLRLQDSSGGQYVALQAPATVGSSFTFTLPSADGSANQVLKTDGSGSLGFTTLSSGLTHLSTVTASGAGTVDIETTFDSTYDAYKIIVTDMTVSSDGTNVFMELKIGGSYLQSGTYDFLHRRLGVDGSGQIYSNGFGNANNGLVAVSTGNDAHASANYEVSIYNPTDTAARHVVRFEGSYYEDDNDIHYVYGIVQNSTTGALTGIRFQPVSGAISGKFRLYGITNG